GAPPGDRASASGLLHRDLHRPLAGTEIAEPNHRQALRLLGGQCARSGVCLRTRGLFTRSPAGFRTRRDSKEEPPAESNCEYAPESAHRPPLRLSSSSEGRTSASPPSGICTFAGKGSGTDSSSGRFGRGPGGSISRKLTPGGTLT